MAQDPAAFRRKFRKMAASPFAFYRGSASLFYADQTGAYRDDSFLDEHTSRVWIHGDLHAENFGTYMNSSGQLVFNVNDFDEAYVGPFSWDLKRFSRQRGPDRLRQGALRRRDHRPGHRVRPVVPDRAAGDRGRRRRRDRLDHAAERGRRTAARCCSRPGSTPGSTCSPGRPRSTTTSAGSPWATASTRSTPTSRRPCRAAFERVPRHAAGGTPGVHQHQGHQAAQGRRHRLGRAAVVQPAARGAHRGPGERRRSST